MLDRTHSNLSPEAGYNACRGRAGDSLECNSLTPWLVAMVVDDGTWSGATGHQFIRHVVLWWYMHTPPEVNICKFSNRFHNGYEQGNSCSAGAALLAFLQASIANLVSLPHGSKQATCM